MKEFIKNLFVSSLVTIFFIVFTKLFPNPSYPHYIALAFILIIFYYLVSSYTNFQLWAIRRERRYFPKIGILNGNIKTAVREYKCQHPWTAITPVMWQEKLKQILRGIWFLKIKMISISEINDSFYMIINPFGDSFPEENLKLHTSFYKICDYINNGGIFAVTGGAFFSHQNTLNSQICEPVITKTIEMVQSLKDTFLYTEFGVLTTGDSFSQGQQIIKEPLDVQIIQNNNDINIFGQIIDKETTIKQWRATTIESSNFIPIIREKNNKSYPLSLINYGKGHLLHAGMYLENENCNELSIIIKSIKSLLKIKNL